jgi:hypothetical protein
MPPNAQKTPSRCGTTPNAFRDAPNKVLARDVLAFR